MAGTLFVWLQDMFDGVERMYDGQHGVGINLSHTLTANTPRKECML